jgi:hypothetical protein
MQEGSRGRSSIPQEVDRSEIEVFHTAHVNIKKVESMRWSEEAVFFLNQDLEQQ